MYPKGSIVEALTIDAVHPRFRGRRGIVEGVGPNLTTVVLFTGEKNPVNMDPTCFDLISLPEEDDEKPV
jgi:ribosomal protein L21E